MPLPRKPRLMAFDHTIWPVCFSIAATVPFKPRNTRSSTVKYFGAGASGGRGVGVSFILRRGWRHAAILSTGGKNLPTAKVDKRLLLRQFRTPDSRPVATATARVYRAG